MQRLRQLRRRGGDRVVGAGVGVVGFVAPRAWGAEGGRRRGGVGAGRGRGGGGAGVGLQKELALEAAGGGERGAGGELCFVEGDAAAVLGADA